MRRTGIDLTSTGCRLVDAESSGSRPYEHASIRIRSSVDLQSGSQSGQLAAELRAVLEEQSLPRHAWVNLWEVPSSHQYRLFPVESQSTLDAKVREQAASALGVDAGDLTVSAAAGAIRGENGSSRKEVSFFAAQSSHISAKLAPLIEAGFVIDGVTTPCGALWAQARLRRPSNTGEVHAYVALGPNRSALGIFCEERMLYGRDLDWGFSSATPGEGASIDREAVAARLARDLRHAFLYVQQFWDDEVSQVVLCGDMPEMRSLTGPLIDRLNVEVETLDTLEGIDPGDVPGAFAERAAAFRLAAAVAVAPPPLSLLPEELRRKRRTAFSKIALATAASLAALGLLYGLFARLSTREGADSTTSNAGAPSASDGPAPVFEQSAPPEPATAQPQKSEPLAALPPRTAARPPDVEPEAMPVLRGILLSNGRRVALIDGRVVAVGDHVGRSTVREIEADGVVLDTPSGTTRLKITRPTLPVSQP